MSEWFKRLKHASSVAKKSEECALKVDDSIYDFEMHRKAVLDSFKNHWLQAWTLMINKRVAAFDGTGDDARITNDDITTIINHIEQMTTLLLRENRCIDSSTPIMMSPLLDYLLMESILDKIFNWSLNAGEYTNVMKLEQLKLYDLLITELCHQSALFQKPLVRPLLQLLATCGDCAPVEVEKRLVILLNTLCVCIVKNAHLLELFFAPYNDQEDINVPSVSDITSSPQIISKFSYLHKPESRFLIFSLLIPFVHREGAIGQQARDGLLMIMSLSKKHEAIGAYIAEHSNFCPVLATGLSGLYSSLPRKLSNGINGDWHRITDDDIRESQELQAFVNSLEFCNAVVQVSHSLVTAQLIEYVYQGFLVSVVGPALHQDTLDVPLDVMETSPKYSNSLEEMIATTAYLELILRTTNEASLLQVFLRFICVEKFDEQRILHTLITRLGANSKLGLVTIVLFRTMLDWKCEDVLLELVLKYLMTCEFVREEERENISDVNSYDVYSQKFLSLIPSCCFATLQTYLPAKEATNSNESANPDDEFAILSPISPTLSHTLHPLYNYIEYLNDAHSAITRCKKACRKWSSNYDVVAKEELAQSPTLSLRLDNSPMDSGIFLNNTTATTNEVSASQVPDCQSTTNSPSVNRMNQSTSFSEESLYIGPFLSNVLNRLSCLATNDVYTNLQLTGLLSQLAAYPQPLLRSFLLNTQLAVNSKCRNLWLVLCLVRNQLDSAAEEMNHFVDYWIRGKNFFKAREELLSDSMLKCFENSENTNRKQSVTSSEVFITLDTPTPKDAKRRSITSLLFPSRHKQSTPVAQPAMWSINNGAGYKYVNKRKQSRVDDGSETEDEQNQKIVLSILVMEEFLKELSALAQEHYILDCTPCET